VTIAPSFILSGPTGTLVAQGIRTVFDDIATATAALRDGTVDLIVGALPFDVRGPAALIEPMGVGTALPPCPAGPMPTVRIIETLPEPDVHRARIASALRRLRDTGNPLQKVVLARALRLTADGPLDPIMILHRLIDADEYATAYLSDLSAAGLTGATLVGASPELLVARFGSAVTCHPFAGSAPRSTDPDVDAANAAGLADSDKDRHEHQLVIDTMRAALEPLCSHLDIATRPQLSRTATLWHLSTPISGTLRDTSTTAMDLALALHPTPAVGGVPTHAAIDLIAELEGDRGFYAGAVGWCDSAGDGRWVVAIRGAQLSADRRSAVAQAGGGIVVESDAQDEVAETTTKFRTILAALGVEQ
jgi:isochorismate synthase